MNSQDLTTKNDLLLLKSEIIQELKAFLKPQPPPKEWLTTKDVMTIFGVKSINTVQNLKRAGLPYKKMGGKCLFYYADILKFINKEK